MFKNSVKYTYVLLITISSQKLTWNLVESH